MQVDPDSEHFRNYREGKITKNKTILNMKEG